MQKFRGRPPIPGSAKWHERQALLNGVTGGVTIVTPNAHGPAPTRHVVLTEAEIIQAAEKKFDFLYIMASGVAEGIIPGLLVTGGPGIGKTHTFDSVFEAAVESKKIQSYVKHSGTISPPKLYELLWDNRETGQVVVLDDTDQVWYDEESLAILKGALNSSPVRRVAYGKNSPKIKSGEMDPDMIYRGSLVFISNIDFQSHLDNKSSKLSPHISAVADRCIMLDLGLHTHDELFYWVRYAVPKFRIMEAAGLTSAEAKEGMTFIVENHKKFRSLSLRTATKIAQLMRMAKLPESKETWQSLAEGTLYKPQIPTLKT